MQYEFRARTLAGVVQKSLSGQISRFERKESVSIDSGRNQYYREDISLYVDQGRSYTISWAAQEDSSDGGSYGIDIRSYDGHGAYREGFQRSGSWDLTARTTGEITFAVGVSRSFGGRWSSYPVDVSID